ncbi:TonB-dependent receptor plug domain-containing protein [Chromobacterium sp. IIBBL 290-4]|uniref:TonB-dependent receptor plug domain-containing protein n=1 Tax=Chromobacterium sp. IIBBL 290-4 TaxID=2953890 RepID=UPI0020B6B0E4|nr:TonB-dependent receptor plug domain-containing protein [Chromobacterium sp. IIBBL 290-4]UTH73907.1 TonB-dependent receptor plug domain-containing protein [Chromobacterium sp. IIBBL 290-4]
MALSIAQIASAADGDAVRLNKIRVEEFVKSKVAVANAVDAEQLARSQPKSLAEALDALPGVNAGGSPRPGGQTINVWGYSKTEQVQVQLDGASQSFSKYQQGTSFIEPELLGRVEVIKGAQSPYYGNGGFGAVVKAETKSVDELLRPGQLCGGFLKGYVPIPCWELC